MQQHCSKYFAPPPPPPPPPPPTTLGDEVNRSKFNFQIMVMLHIKLNGITKCSNMVPNILLPDTPPPDPRGQNSTFSEQCNVAYQIKGNHECSNMVTTILPVDPPLPLTLGLGSKGQNSTFSEYGNVAYQIKGNHKMQQHGRNTRYKFDKFTLFDFCFARRHILSSEFQFIFNFYFTVRVHTGLKSIKFALKIN